MSARDLAAFAADIARFNYGINRARLAYAAENDPHPCHDCGAEVTAFRTSRCDKCLRERKNAAERARRAQTKEKP